MQDEERRLGRPRQRPALADRHLRLRRLLVDPPRAPQPLHRPRPPRPKRLRPLPLVGLARVECARAVRGTRGPRGTAAAATDRPIPGRRGRELLAPCVAEGDDALPVRSGAQRDCGSCAEEQRSCGYLPNELE